MQSICYKKKKFMNDGEQKESVCLLLKRSTKAFCLQIFFIIFYNIQ